MILPSALKVVILLDYLLHREYIIENYCVNIDEPMVMCNASCYLSDQLQNTDHRNDGQFPLAKIGQLDILAPFKIIRSADKEFGHERFRKDVFCPNQNLYSSDWLSDIFRPPCFNLI